MTTPNQMATALLTEHFRYTPLTLLDDVINTVNELVFRAVNAIEEGLNNATPENLGFRPDDNLPSAGARREALQELKQTEIDNGIVKLESLLNATVDKDFDKFEIYTLRNILALGHEEEQLVGWVQLDHYKNLDLTRTKNAPTPEQVQLQRRKLHESAKLNAMLKAEHAKNAALLEQVQSFVGSHTDTKSESDLSLAFLTSSAPTLKDSNGQSLDQNVLYALSHLPAIRQHILHLKQTTRALPNARRKEVNGESLEFKRNQYIGTQYLRALERKGIEPGNEADLAAGRGRKIGREEIEGIEAVVQALGGADATMRSNDEMEE